MGDHIVTAGVGAEVTVRARGAWRRGRVVRVKRGGTIVVAVRIPSTGAIKRTSVAPTSAWIQPVGWTPEDDPEFHHVHNDRGWVRVLAVPAPTLAECAP